MQTTAHAQPQPRFWAGLWAALTSLQFITSFFGWFFMLLSRLAEPMMSLSAIYIIICAGIPQWKLDGIYNVGVAVMIAAPEIILPGAFVLAGQYGERSDSRAKMLYWIAWMFVALTFFTLADLFIFHLEGTALNALMWGRCAVGISYSILLRVLTHGGEMQESAQPAQEAPAFDYAEIARHLRAFFPQEAPQPHIDYEALVRQLVPLMPVPQVDYRELALHMGATFTATIREVQGAISGSQFDNQVPHVIAEPNPRVREPRPHREPIAMLPGASDNGVGEKREKRIQDAYDQLTGLGVRVSGRSLAEAAHVKRSIATEWLRAKSGVSGKAEEEREPVAI